MPRIVFTPTGLAADVTQGTTVLAAARKLGVDLDSVCGGRGICGRCQITPSAGSFAKWSIDSSEDSLSARTDTEANYKGRRALTTGRRLGCAAQVCGDVVVDVPADSQVHRQVVRKSVDLTDVIVDPLVSLSYIVVPAPVLGDEPSTGEAVIEALHAQHGRVATGIDMRVLPRLQPAFVNDERAATVAVREQRVVAIWPR